MSEHIQRVRQVTNDGVTTETTRVDDADTAVPATQSQRSSIAARIVWYIAGILLVLLAFRFVFILFGANPANGFANFIYTASHPFAAPFFGIFSYNINYGVSRVELASLVAMVQDC